MPFSTPLIVMEVSDSKWRLVKDLVYHGNNDTFTVLSGFNTDFASVPRLFWNIIPPTGRYTKAAVLHDWFYQTHVVSRKDADGMFRKIMKEERVGFLKRNIMGLVS